MIEVIITIREGKEKIGVAIQMSGMKTASEEELNEFMAIHDALMARQDELGQKGVDGYADFYGMGPEACKLLTERIKNL